MHFAGRSVKRKSIVASKWDRNESVHVILAAKTITTGPCSDDSFTAATRVSHVELSLF